MRITRFCLLLVFLIPTSTLLAELFPPVQCGNDPQTICRSLCFEELAYCPPPNVPYTFLWTRPVYRNIAAQQALWHDVMVNYCTDQTFAMQGIFFYQHSTHSEGINEFFLFNDTDTLNVKGDAVIFGNSNLRDVRAEWLGLPSNFIGTCSTKPKQQQIGFWLETKLDLNAILCHEFFERLWLGIAVPFQVVKNNVRLTQTPPQNPGTRFPGGLVEALNNPSFFYAKFGPEQKASGASEMNFRFGTKLLDRDGFQIGLYSMFLVPLHTHAKPEFVFSPIVGNNRHFGVGTGLFFQLPMNRCICNGMVSFVFEAESIYFFKNNQRRTFDLKKKPWSRYMLYNKVNGQSNINGPRFLTRKSQVKPYNMIEAVGAIRFDRGDMQAEIGYHVWARPRETLLLLKPFPEKYGIAGDGTLIPGTNVQATASLSTISHQAPNDIDELTGLPTFITIKEKDVELQSGTSPAAVSHMVFASIGYVIGSKTGDLMLNFGVYGEIPQYQTSMSTIGIWGKVGFYI